MQDPRSIGGGGARIFGGDRRMRPHPNQALRCPRCDSLNTKFCYYNNYNLSQPRHFCKSCRRYWTKGGVLRNVPVGGGCRKTKRSKPKPSPELHKEIKSASHSSSESSSLTATTTATATEAVSAPPSSSSAALPNFPNSRLLVSPTPNPNPNFEPLMPPDGGLFMETGSYTSLMTAANQSLMGINLSEISPFRLHHQQKKLTSMGEEMKMQEVTAGFMDQTGTVELGGMQGRTDNGGLTALEWQSSGEQGLYELPSSVDQGFWSQSQWADSDHPLYHY